MPVLASVKLTVDSRETKSAYPVGELRCFRISKVTLPIKKALTILRPTDRTRSAEGKNKSGVVQRMAQEARHSTYRGGKNAARLRDWERKRRGILEEHQLLGKFQKQDLDKWLSV